MCTTCPKDGKAAGLVHVPKEIWNWLICQHEKHEMHNGSWRLLATPWYLKLYDEWIQWGYSKSKLFFRGLAFLLLFLLWLSPPPPPHIIFPAAALPIIQWNVLNFLLYSSNLVTPVQETKLQPSLQLHFQNLLQLQVTVSRLQSSIG